MNKETLDNLLHDIQEHCGEDEDLVRRYDDYAATDAEKALKQMLMRTGTMTRSPRLELCDMPWLPLLLRFWYVAYFGGVNTLKLSRQRCLRKYSTP